MTKQCSFCGTDEESGVSMIEGISDAYICTNCVQSSAEECEEIVENKVLQSNTFLKPHEIKEELDKYIVGQDEAKKILAVAVYNHYKRIHSKSRVEIKKSNIMLVGPTGSGKTYVMEILAKILNLPLVIVDATSLTEAGYIGEDVESILGKLLQKANGDVKKAEKGIVYIDEVDKIGNKKFDNKKASKDISGEGVQQALLKMIEDSEVQVQLPGAHVLKQKVTIQTKNVLFVCGGAFVGIEDIFKKRLNPEKSTNIGFKLNNEEDLNSTNELDKDITQQDIIDYGFIPEFAGRIPVITTLKPLTKENLKDILVNTKNSVIKQYQALLRIDGVRLKFSNDAIDYIVEEAMKKEVGARGLKGVIEKRMYDIMFELPKQEDIKTYTITKDVLLNK